ncbi:MAG: zinc ribbon domain-containing protein [Clostridia bacterium]|nr:zinc ribbon domain-containing protein [Clostridia bacterium]
MDNFTSKLDELNEKLKSEETRLEAVYNHIGKLYCTVYKDAYTQDFECLMELKNEREASIKNIKDSIRKEKGLKLCPKCGSEFPIADVVCPSCGHSTESSNTISPARLTCRNCGSLMPGDLNFCMECGTPLVKPAAPDKQAKRFCRKCGSPTDQNMIFCVSCGTRI